MQSNPKQALGKGIKKALPKKVNPATVSHYMKGIIYPTDKKALLQRAALNKAPDDILHVIGKMEDKPYRTLVVVLEEASNHWVDPDYKKQTLVQAPQIDRTQEPAFQKKEKRQRRFSPLLLKLCERFPKVFDLNNPKPLKIGIREDILESLKDDPEVTKPYLQAVLRRHVMGNNYCWAIVKGTHRFDLEGNEAGKISDDDKKGAQSLIEWKKKIYQQKNKEQSDKKEPGTLP